jgi:hypothetical protein
MKKIISISKTCQNKKDNNKKKIEIKFDKKKEKPMKLKKKRVKKYLKQNNYQ